MWQALAVILLCCLNCSSVQSVFPIKEAGARAGRKAWDLSVGTSTLQCKPRGQTQAKPPVLSTRKSHWLRSRDPGPHGGGGSKPESSWDPGFNPYCFPV